jgi:hypothetical protein
MRGRKGRENLTKFGWKARLGEFCEVLSEESEERAAIGEKVGSAKKKIDAGRCDGGEMPWKLVQTLEGLASTS